MTDCYSRRPAGWAVAHHMRIDLVGSTLGIAGIGVSLYHEVPTTRSRRIALNDIAFEIDARPF